jgi:hypothetical protein
MSGEERRRKKREAEKLRRKRIQSNPILRAQELEKRRKRIARLKEIRKSKKISKKEVEQQREKWRLAKQKKSFVDFLFPVITFLKIALLSHYLMTGEC